MGDELVCEVHKGRRSFRAKALLETDEVIVRGPEGFTLPFAEITGVAAKDGTLRLSTKGGSVSLSLGARAVRWEEKIRTPKGLLAKLGVKAGMRARLEGPFPEAFRAELTASGVSLVRGDRCDLVFLAAEDREALSQLSELKRLLAPAGALWVVRPKGSDAISEGDVLSQGKVAALVDVKVVRFSETHSAAKLVIPVKDRIAVR
jgi:hypothetical protein